MRYRKLLSLLLCAVLCVSGVRAVETDAPAESAGAPAAPLDPAAAYHEKAAKVPVEGQAPNAPSLACMGAAVLCAENGQLLLGKGAEEKLAPASVTKLMTALLVLENCPDLEKTTTVTETAVKAVEPGSTHIALDRGEVVTLRDMMGAMLVESANDAANVLAEVVGGSLEGFADKMNEKAREIGCTNTHFVNPNGLDAPEHYTTAHDMARIGAALTKYPQVFDFLGCAVYQMPATNLQPERSFGTKQNFLRKNSMWYDADVLGGKNGWTTNAHQTLVTFKRTGGVTLVAVALGGGSKTDTLTDTAALFRYGYDAFRAITLSAADQAAAAQKAYPDADIDALRDTLLLLPKDEKESALALSCAENAGALALEVQASGKPLLSLPLARLTSGAPTGETDGEAVTTAAATQEKHGVVGNLLRGVLLCAGVLLALLLLLCAYRAARIRRQRRRIREMRARDRRDNREHREP